MNVGSWLLWGFAATVVLTTLLAGSQALGLTRMNLPYLLGTMVTPDRDRARLVGVVLHLAFGLAFSAVYVAAFEQLGRATWLLGALTGLVHGAFVATVLMTILPSLHPRMASERQGPTVTPQLEPPGFLGLHYGARTPVSILAAHVVFGAIVGGFYAV